MRAYNTRSQNRDISTRKSGIPSREATRASKFDTGNLQQKSSVTGSPSHPRIFRIFDAETKSEATRVLATGISSISRDCIEACVFSKHERSGFHTWALCARGVHGAQVLSTVVFRRHAKVSIIELGLIATDRDWRGSGYGSKLIHHMLQTWKGEGYEYVVTFADLTAVPFFESVGFRSHIPVPRDLFDCWIDKYSQSVLMCFCMHHPMLTDVITSDTEPVEVLVFMDNVDRRPSERWVKGVVTDVQGERVRVTYSYELRTYSEWLPEESIRLRLPV